MRAFVEILRSTRCRCRYAACYIVFIVAKGQKSFRGLLFLLSRRELKDVVLWSQRTILCKSVLSQCHGEETHPSLALSNAGVVLPDVLGLNLPYDLSSASFSFNSRTSARRLRKSEKLIRPPTCTLSRSSAEAVWFTNDRGVDVPDGGSEGSDITARNSRNVVVVADVSETCNKVPCYP